MCVDVYRSIHPNVTDMFSMDVVICRISFRISICCVGLFALRRTSLLIVASGYISSILVLTHVTREGMKRLLQRLLAVKRIPTCALYTLHNTDIHQFVAI